MDKINDDTIQDAFAWPVRYDDENMQVVDVNGDTIVNIVERSYDADALGEVIAAMLNERYASHPEFYEPCVLCGHWYGYHDKKSKACPYLQANTLTMHPTNRFTRIGEKSDTLKQYGWLKRICKTIKLPFASRRKGGSDET